MNDWDAIARRAVGYVVAFGLGVISGAWLYALLIVDLTSDP